MGCSSIELGINKATGLSLIALLESFPVGNSPVCRASARMLALRSMAQGSALSKVFLLEDGLGIGEDGSRSATATELAYS